MGLLTSLFEQKCSMWIERQLLLVIHAPFYALS